MKTVIITGAKGNLGSAVVKIFLKKKYKVIACISPREDRMKTEDSNVEYFSLDLTESMACKNFAATVSTGYDTINAAILTVGGFTAGSIEKATKSDFEKMFTLNFVTAFNIVQPFLKKMMQQSEGGKIILIGSRPGMHGSEAKGSIAYGFSKSLLFRLAELINEQGKEKNISATVIVPSTIDTPQNRAAMPDADFTKWVKAEIIGEKIEHICSDKEKYKSGEVVEISGND